MYCKNCGEEIQEEAAICVKCGFANGTGTKFCGHCGKEVAEGQAICMSCGFYVNQPEGKKEEPSAAKSATEAICEEYRAPVRRSLKLSIVKSGITIALVLALFFLPIFRYERNLSEMAPEELSQMSALNDVEALAELLEKGTVTKSFSWFSETKIVLEALLDRENESLTRALAFKEALCPVISLIVFLAAPVFASISLYRRTQELKELDKTTVLWANEMKKKGAKEGSGWRESSVFTVLIYMVMDFFFIEVFGKILEEQGVYGIRAMNYFSGFSPIVLIVIALFVAFAIVYGKKKQVDKQMLLSITEKEYAEAQQ